MAWAGGAACELAPPPGAIDTVTFGHSYSFAHSGHDPHRCLLEWRGIDKRHDNHSIFFLAASAPPCWRSMEKYCASSHHLQRTYHESEPNWSSTSLPGSTTIVAEPGECMPWGASGAPEAARQRCGCDLVGAHAVLVERVLEVVEVHRGLRRRGSGVWREKMRVHRVWWRLRLTEEARRCWMLLIFQSMT